MRNWRKMTSPQRHGGHGACTEKSFLCLRGFICVLALSALLIGFLPGAFAESLHDRLAHAEQLRQDGKFDVAMGVYREVQVDAPELESLPYALACTAFGKAESLLYEAPDQALEAYRAAATAFQAVFEARDDALRREARLGAANCAARIAEIEARPEEYLETPDKNAVPPDEVKKRVSVLRQASLEYEQFLQQYPDSEAARRNLERLRYYWKRMVQETPQPVLVRIIGASTEYPAAAALPLPEEASVVLVPRSTQGTAP